jgi:cellulose synthase/poly-beta-1,6-N-acetylglucosamine synthase-like glycosyltransferase
LLVRARGAALAGVLALGALLAAKVEFRSPYSNDIFYGYGICVTTVILVTMTVSLVFYRDLAIPEHRRRRTTSEGSRAAGPPHVSCIVAVHNEARLVTSCVESMVGQSYENKEIIVIDDASTDGTIEVLRDLRKRLPITLFELPVNRGKKGALAAGLLASNGSIIAFADSDTIWNPDALALAIPIFGYDADIGAVSGHCRALNAYSGFLAKVQDTWYEGQFALRKAFESVFGAVTCVSGPLALFRRAAIYNFMPAWQADSFMGDEFRFATDRTLTAFVLGGTFFGPRVLPAHGDSPFASPEYQLKDWKIVYSKSARALTQVPPTFRAMLKQQVRWKKSFIRNTFMTGRFYWRRPLLPALFYYIHVIFVFLGPFIAARHLIYLPLRGDPMSALLYLFGIVFIGLSFGLAFRYENPGSRQWLLRPVMSLMSTLMFSWLIFYSVVTIKRMTWHRG